MPNEVKTPEEGELVLHAKVFATATRIQVPGLQKLATTRFIEAAEANLNHKSFAEVTDLVYTTSAEEENTLRDVLVDTILKKRSLLNSPEVRSVVHKTPVMVYQLLKVFLEKYENTSITSIFPTPHQGCPIFKYGFTGCNHRRCKERTQHVCPLPF